MLHPPSCAARERERERERGGSFSPPCSTPPASRARSLSHTHTHTNTHTCMLLTWPGVTHVHARARAHAHTRMHARTRVRSRALSLSHTHTQRERLTRQKMKKQMHIACLTLSVCLSDLHNKQVNYLSSLYFSDLHNKRVNFLYCLRLQIYITNECFPEDLVNGECTCFEGWGQRGKDCMNKNWISVYDASILDERAGASAASKYLASIYFAVVAFSTGNRCRMYCRECRG